MLKHPRTIDVGPITELEPTPPLSRGPVAPAASTDEESGHAAPVDGPDLDEELALHEEIKLHRADPPDLDPAIEAILHRRLDANTHEDTA
jgi:hypothetical protein